MFKVILAGMIMLLAFVVVITVITFFFCLNMIYINLRTLVPWVKAPLINLEKILQEIDLPAKSLVCDLGCGDGRFLFLAETKGFKAVGYELALYPYLKARISKFLKNSDITIENKNFFKQDLSQADAIFIFLNSIIIKKVGEKLRYNLKPGVKIISYGFEIPGWKIFKVLDTIPSKTYIY